MTLIVVMCSTGQAQIQEGGPLGPAPSSAKKEGRKGKGKERGKKMGKEKERHNVVIISFFMLI